METEGMELEIIINPKTTDDGQAVIQVRLLWTDRIVITNFDISARDRRRSSHQALQECTINVPRYRFLPVKSYSDLLLIKSDVYSLEHGQLVISGQRMFENTPVIKLGDHFIQQFQERLKKIFKIIPKIIALDHLTVTGDVYFGCNVTLRGTVIGAHFPCSCSFLSLTTCCYSRCQ